MKIAIIGYGKMGRLIEQTARKRGHEIVSVIDVDNREDFDSNAFGSADAAIEFTTPAAAYENVLRAFARHVKVVSGSTGWFAQHEEEMRRLCEEGKQTLFWSSNFSVGVALFTAANKYLAQLMNNFPQYDVRIEETHHIHKADAPSGTAISLAETVTGALDRKKQWAKGTLSYPDNETNPRENKTIAPDILRIDSVRRGEVPGIHSIIYNSEADRITLTHEAHNRSGFALGAVMAAEFASAHSGLLSMEDLFHF